MNHLSIETYSITPCNIYTLSSAVIINFLISAMGCFQSKRDSGDIHPNVFRVVNIDEGGADLWSGQLEVTENDLILYREGRDAITWPLRCLRRYGFDGEIFSFESGRRCDTGEGIYAFRCRRAGMLFRTLQQNIQVRNVISDSMPFQLPNNIMAGSPTSVPRQTLQASIVHRSSIDNGLPDINVPNINNNLSMRTTIQTRVPNNASQSPRSPSSVDILEVMPLYPRSQNNTNHATNVYQLRGFKSKEHNNNNQAESTSDHRHLYSNDLNRDLAFLRNTLKQEAVLNTIKDIEDETQFLQSRYVNENIPVNTNVPLSPTPSNVSEHYAQLSMEQQMESARLYMNIVPTDSCIKDRGDGPSTPLTPKQADYYNFNVRPEINSYANLAIGDITDRNAKHTQNFNSPLTEVKHKYSESDTYTSMSPVEELEVNYAVLDIDGNKEVGKARDLVSPENQSYASSKNDSTTSHCSTHQRNRLVSQGSTEKNTSTNNTVTSPVPSAGIGYTTIDFDKTVALTSVVAAESDFDKSRKTRHNSLNVACSSPISNEKSKGN